MWPQEQQRAAEQGVAPGAAPATHVTDAAETARRHGDAGDPAQA